MDNNQNGEVNDQNVLEEIKKKRAILIMTEKLVWEDSEDTEVFWSEANSYEGDTVYQDLAAEETGPDSAVGRNVSQEETHHVLHISGWETA